MWKNLGQIFWGLPVYWPKIVHLLRKHVLSSKYRHWQMPKSHSLSHGSRQGWQPSSVQAGGRRPGRAVAPPRTSHPILAGAGTLPVRPGTGCPTADIPAASYLAPFCSHRGKGGQGFACCGPTGIANVHGRKKKTAAFLISPQLAKTPPAFSTCMYR